MSCITTKYHACMSTPCSVGNVNIVKSCKGGERVLDALKLEPVNRRRKCDRKIWILQNCQESAWGSERNPEKRLVLKSEKKGQGSHRLAESMMIWQKKGASPLKRSCKRFSVTQLCGAGSSYFSKMPYPRTGAAWILLKLTFQRKVLPPS